MIADDGEAATALGAGWLEQLLGALRLLRRHILTEQDGAFPAALGALDPADWDAVDAVRARVAVSVAATAATAAAVGAGGG